MHEYLAPRSEGWIYDVTVDLGDAGTGYLVTVVEDPPSGEAKNYYERSVVDRALVPTKLS
ncbi:hypothetical protein [Nocardioides sp.]|uniref:hypothetical protein n=1 Tax=Nocardioides sp. TaxID=35761 RepID=UPI00271D570E|nr:hypothetical protein [Nocardioides sp.]MDO9457326.1 hypothetical protein [Nocardioides sp.]